MDMTDKPFDQVDHDPDLDQTEQVSFPMAEESVDDLDPSLAATEKMSFPDVDPDAEEVTFEAVGGDDDDDEEVVFIREWDDQRAPRFKGKSAYNLAKRKRVVIATASLVVVVVASALSYLALSIEGRGYLPDELAGLWTTDEPRYANAALQLAKAQVGFMNRGSGGTRYDIETVQTFRSDSGARYVVNYVDTEGELFLLEFYHKSQPEHELRLTSQPLMVWRRGGGRRSEQADSTAADGADSTATDAEREAKLSPLPNQLAGCIKAAAQEADGVTRCADAAAPEPTATRPTAAADSVAWSEILGAPGRRN